jgi:hypothetical protein
MNFVFLSPHFPPNYYQFCVRLHHLGVNVLGLADEPYESLNPHLKGCLTEYYRVNDMHNYEELLRACGYFTHRYGKLDRIDSHNEYWLDTEARLRTDFNIPGLKTPDMPKIKQKSAMKEVYKIAGVNTARGKVVKTLAEAKRLVKQIGYPLVAKPDIGVGAAKTYKIHNSEELEQFFAQKPLVDYILEEFIAGPIYTFDGLTDRDGNVVFLSSMQYSQGIMETVINDDIIYYYTLVDIPPDLDEAGRRVIKAFNVRERFFHFEFFRADRDGQLVALEVNMRPPGGMTTDMMNYANDIDVYKEWANIIVHNRFTAEVNRRYHCCYVGRKFNRSYANTHEQILSCFGEKIVHHEMINGVFSAALGDYGYLVRTPDLTEIHAIAEFIQRPAA